MEDTEFTKYTAKLFLNRKNFYASNPAATMSTRQSTHSDGFTLKNIRFLNFTAMKT